MNRSGSFTQFASQVASLAGRPATFAIACAAMVLWAVAGPFLGFSEVWQLTVNTGTTIITFLMVFIIQNTQNRDSRALQIKLDELIRANRHAHNALLDLEELEEKELEEFQRRYAEIARNARKNFVRDDRDVVSIELPDPNNSGISPGKSGA